MNEDVELIRKAVLSQGYIEGSQAAFARIESQLRSLTEENERLRDQAGWPGKHLYDRVNELQDALSEAEQRAVRYEAVIEAAKAVARFSEAMVASAVAGTPPEIYQSAYDNREDAIINLEQALSPIDPPLGQEEGTA